MRGMRAARVRSGKEDGLSMCNPIKCGDGQRESSGAVSEECDDGNTAGGDGCSAEVLRLPPLVLSGHAASLTPY